MIYQKQKDMKKFIVFYKDNKEVKREILRETKSCYYVQNDVAVGKTGLVRVSDDTYTFNTSNWHSLYTKFKLSQIFTSN